MVISGIYKISNTENGKFYIGSSKNIVKRWNEHKWALKNNRHRNRPMQSAYNKYGADVFIYEVIEVVNDIEQLRNIEQKYINSLNACGRTVGYNLSERVDCVCLSGDRHPQYGKTWSQKSKDKLSKSISGKNHPLYGTKVSESTKAKMRATVGDKLRGKNNPRCKSVIQYSLNGEFIKIWDYAKQATEEIGIDNSIILKCCKGGVKSAGGFKWEYNNIKDVI